MWEKARSQLAEELRRAGIRLKGKGEHPIRPRREDNCPSKERNSRGTNQEDKPKIKKKGQRLIKQAQVSSVLCYSISSVESRIKPDWVPSPTSQRLTASLGTHL